MTGLGINHWIETEFRVLKWLKHCNLKRRKNKEKKIVVMSLDITNTVG